MAITQFKIPERMASNDQLKFSSPRDYQFVSLTESDKLTEIGALYIKDIVNGYHALGIHLDADDIEKMIFCLPRSEQFIMIIPILPGAISGSIDYQFRLLHGNHPCCKSRTKNQVFIPSMSLINNIMQRITDKPMMIMPCHGIVNATTFMNLHQDNIHPGALYSKHVKNNLTEPHAWQSGPFLSFMHDVLHIASANLLSSKQREFIFAIALPMLRDELKDMSALW